MHELPQSSMFTTAEARTLGCTISQLKHAQRTGQVLRHRRGVYVRPGQDERFLDERAAAIRYPDVPLGGVSAARVYAIPVVAAGDGLPEMTIAPRSNADMPGVHPYRARTREHEVVMVDGVRVTSVARTVIDLARHRPIRTSVPALDHVLHHRMASADELRDVLDFCRTWPGARRARRAVQLCDSRAESPLESISRLVIPRLGLPVPDSQTTFVDQFGVFVGRGDFYWDEFGVVGEADGRGKYVDTDVIFAEKDRHEGLDDLGLQLTRWGWDRVWSEPTVMGRRIRNAFERGAARDGAGLPRLWTPIPAVRIAVL